MNYNYIFKIFVEDTFSKVSEKIPCHTKKILYFLWAVILILYSYEHLNYPMKLLIGIIIKRSFIEIFYRTLSYVVVYY